MLWESPVPFPSLHFLFVLFQLDYANEPVIKNLLMKYVDIFREQEKKRELNERRRFPLEKRLKENIVGQVH